MKTKILCLLIAVVLAVGLMPMMVVNASEVTTEELTAENTASVKTLTDGMTYFITQDLTINASKSNKNGLVVANGATVTLSIPYGTTLTVYGKNGSGTTGGGAAILLPSGSTLKIVGSGKLVAVGGNAGNGSNGGSGSRSIANDNTNGHYKNEFGSNTTYFAGAGGTGGAGGGGAGAGIGTNGGSGGSGKGAGGSGWNDSGIVDSNRNGFSGSAGASGSSASASGNLICDATIDMTGVVGGSAGSAGGSGSRGSDGYDGDEGDARGIAGGAGGGGGGGGLAGAAVGTGGGGGGQGGGGGSAGYIWGGRYVGGGGGGGGQGNGTSGGGAYGSDGVIPKYDCENDRASSVTVHQSSTSGGNGSRSSYGIAGKGANMTIRSNGGKDYRGTAGSGGSGGNSGSAASVYTANDSSGKYLIAYVITWIVDGVTTTESYSYGETPEFKGSTDKEKDAEYIYTFAGWDTEIAPVTGDATYTATYDKALRAYDASVGESLYGSVIFESSSVVIGDTLTATITPNEGYEVENVTINGEVATKVAENQFTFSMPTSDVVVDVIYKKIPYNVNLFNDGSSTGGNYSVDMEQATIGDTVTITINPNLGYLVDTVDVNGVAAINNGDGTYSFTMPAQEVLITVEFDIDLPAIAKELQELNDADEVLQNAIASGDDDLSDEIIALQSAIDALEAVKNNYADADSALETRLNTAITNAKNDAVSAASEALTIAKNELNAAISLKADATEVNAALETLQSAIDALEAVKNNYADADSALETRLDTAITNAKNDAVSAAETLVNNATNVLQTKLDTKANTTEVNAALATLQSAIDALEAVKNNYADADSALETRLDTAITNAKNDAVSAASEALTIAKNELNEAISLKADTATLNVKVDELASAIAAAKAVANAAIEANGADKLELTAKIEEADAALKNTIDALSAELATTINKVAQLEAFTTAVCILSCVALGGSGVLATVFFLGKRKRG